MLRGVSACLPDSLRQFGFSKESHLRKGWEFDRVYRSGRRLHGKGFSLIHCPSEDGSQRMGISIHRNIKGAVRRNRLKRIIRESFRLQREAYPEAADCVFTVRADFVCPAPLAVSQAVMQITRRSHATDDV